MLFLCLIISSVTDKNKLKEDCTYCIKGVKLKKYMMWVKWGKVNIEKDMRK